MPACLFAFYLFPLGLLSLSFVAQLSASSVLVFDLGSVVCARDNHCVSLVGACVFVFASACVPLELPTRTKETTLN